MAQEDIRIENALYLYTHLTSGLANGEDVITDTTLIYDKILKMRLEDVNKLLYDRPTKLNLQNRTLVTLYKLTNYNSTIVLSEYERSSSIEILRGNGWQESPFFTDRGDIFSTTAFYDELFNIIELSDGFYWSLAKYFFRNTTKIDVIDQKQLYIYVKNCEETPNTPSGGHYDFDEDILYDVIWKNKEGDNLDWSLEIKKGDIYVWQSSCIAYNDGSDLKWSNPIRIILNLGELLNLLKGTSLLSITLYTNSETKPSIDSIKNVFINPRIIKENPKKNPYVLIVGGEEVDWNDKDGIWKLDLPTEGKIWITNRICSYDFDTEILTGTEWSEPRLFMNIDEIINNVLEEIEDAKDLAIENTQSQINSLKDEADNIVKNMNDASIELDTLKNNYEQSITDAILYKRELDEINNEYFGEGGIVDREIKNLSTLIPDKNLIIEELSQKGNLFSPYSVSEILSVNTNLDNIYVIGNPSLISGNNIDSGKLTYLLNDTDNNTILITQGKSYQGNDFTNTSELEGKENIIVKGNYDNTTKSITDSYIIEQDNIYAKLNEYKEYTNGILSSWGLTGEGVLIEGEESKYTTLQAIVDALNGKISSEIQSVKSNLESNYVNKTYLELTAEDIKASVSYSEFITVDTVEISGELKVIISIPDSNDLYIYLKYKEEKEGALDGIHIKYCTAKDITDVNEVSIDNEKISYQFKINRSDIPNDHNLLIILNCESDIIEITVRYSIGEALTGLKIDKDGIEANVVNRILKDEETINNIALSIFTSTEFETKFNEATTIDGLTISNKFAELNESVEGIEGKIGKITDNEGNLKLDLSFINLTNNKIKSSIMEANIIYDENLIIDLIEGNKETPKTITLPVRKYIKVSNNPEENTYYNSPYYIIYNGGTIQIETDNIDEISGSHIYEDIISGSTIELIDVLQTISLKVKDFSEENTEKKIQVKFGYNSTTAMSLLILTSKYIANTIYGGDGFSGLQLTVNSISSEIYNKDEDGQSNFTLLKLSIGEIKTIVTNEEEGKEGLVLKFSDIKETVDEINLRTGDLNYSDYKDIKLIKGEDSGPISLSFKNCSYKITFDPIKVSQIGYTKSNIARVLEGYTMIENGEIIEITDEENISFKYEDNPNELNIKPDELDVKISVLTSAMVASLNITPESIVQTVTLAIDGSKTDIQSAMISLTTNNISSIINNGNTSAAIIQSINNDTSLTLISSDRIVLDGDVIAKAISSKSLNIDNLTYIFGKNDLNRELTNLIAEHNFTNTDPYNIPLIKNSKYEILFTFENIEPESKISITKIKDGENITEDISIDNLKKNINIDKDYFDNGYTSIEISVNQNCSMQIFETTSIIDDIATKGTLTDSRYPLLYIGAGTTGLSNFRSDGSGYLAGGTISWDRYEFDENGNISIDTDGNKIIKEDADFTLDINGIIHAKAGLIGAWTISSLIKNSDGGYLYSKDNYGNIMQINAKNGIISFSEKSNEEVGEENISTISPNYNFNIGVDGNVMFSKGNIKFNADGSCILGNNKKSCIEIGTDGNVNISTAMNIGIYADNAVTYLSNGTAGFVSSTLEKYVCSKETYNFFKNKTVKAGEGYLANGNIYWNEDGDLTISGSFELLSSSNEFGNNVVSVMHRMPDLRDFDSCLDISYKNSINIGIHSLYNMTTISKDNYNDIDLVKSISYLNNHNTYSYEDFCYGTIFNYDLNFNWDGRLLKNYNEEFRTPDSQPSSLKDGQENPYTKQYELLPYIYIKDNGGGSNIVGHFFMDFDLLTNNEYVNANENDTSSHTNNLEILYNMIFYYKWLGLNPHEIYFPSIRIAQLLESYYHGYIKNPILTSKNESKYLKDIFLNYFFNEQSKYHKSIKLKDPKKYYGKIMEFELTMELELASTYIYYMLLASHHIIEYSSLYLPYIGFEDDVPDSKRIVSLNSLYKTISYENLDNIESHFCFIDSGIYNKYQPINPYILNIDTGNKYRPNYSTSIRLCLTPDAILKLAAGGSIKIKASAKKSSGRLLKEETKDNASQSGQLSTYIQEFYYWELSSDLLFYSDPNVIYYQSGTEFISELTIYNYIVEGTPDKLKQYDKIKDIDVYGGKYHFVEGCINCPYIYRKYLIENEIELSKIVNFETSYFNNMDQIRKMLNESYLIQTSFDIVDTIFKNRYHYIHPDNIIKYDDHIYYETKKDTTDERIIDINSVSNDVSASLWGKFIYLLQKTVESSLPTELISLYKPKDILPDIFNANGTVNSQYVWNNINYKILKIHFDDDSSNEIHYIQYIPLSEFHCKKYENIGPVGGYWVYSNNGAYMLIKESDMNDNYNGFYYKKVQDYYLYA